MKMKSSISPTICILVTSTLILVGGTSPVVADEADDMAAISTVWVQYRKSLNSGDMDAMISLWMDDSIQLAPGSLPVYGRENIRIMAEVPLDDYIRNVAVIEEKETQIMGDWAYSWGMYKGSLTPKGGGETYFVDGKFFTMLKRQSDGSWKIYRDIFNSNVPPSQN